MVEEKAQIGKSRKKLKAKEKKPEPKILFTTGKRKRAIARARFKAGKGLIKINRKPLEVVPNEITRLKIEEPLLLTGDVWKRFDIDVNIHGGGIMGQAEAARQAIAKGLAQLLGKDVKETFLRYDRNLLVYDPRRTEPHKPPRSSKGSRRYKQRSKR